MTRIPNFVIGGAAKSGTTALAHYLEQHPQVFLARPKEGHYFLASECPPAFTGPGDEVANRSYVTNRDAFLERFAAAREEIAVGEASVFYLYRPQAFRRALDMNPDMRVVILLRNPVDRAHSAYMHLVRLGRETLSFEDGLDAEAQRIADNWEYCWHYAEVSRYLAQLRLLFSIVPTAQVCTLLYDDLEQVPKSVMKTVFRFLGVDDSFLPKTSLRINASGEPRSSLVHGLVRMSEGKWNSSLKRIVPRRAGVWLKETVRNLNLRRVEMDPEVRQRLEQELLRELPEIESLIGRSLAHWRPLPA
jgi:hypothetical protein